MYPFTLATDLPTLDTEIDTLLRSGDPVLARLGALKWAESSFEGFIRLLYPKRTFAPFQLDFIRLLDKLEKRTLIHPTTGKPVYNLLTNFPPRHAKTHYGTINFAAYLMGRNTKRKVMVSTYNATLAQDFGGETKAIVSSPEFHKIFPRFRMSPDKKSSDEWKTTDRGAYYAIGLDGTTSGRPANCIAENALIHTREGLKKIQDVAVGDYALSATPDGHLEYRRVLATRSIPNRPLIAITTRDSFLACTPDHRIHTETGYAPASEIGTHTRVSVLRGELHAQMAQALQSREVLLTQLRGQGSHPARHAVVRGLRRQLSGEALPLDPALLLTDLLGKRTIWEQDPAEAVRKLREDVRAAEQHGSRARVLEGMQLGAALDADERQAEPALPAWRGELSLSPRLEIDLGLRQEAGQLHLRGLREGLAEARRPSHRHAQGEQLADQSDLDMPSLSYDPPQDAWFGFEPAGRIEEVGHGTVYDLQVEGNHNFFANGILVHNCLIVDDPIKNRGEADSQATRKFVWDQITSAFWSRLEPEEDGLQPIQIMTLTRWHPDDPAGRLAKLPEWDEGEWLHVYFQGLTELPPDPATPETKQYKALWPERFPVSYLLRQKSRSERDFAALYQQQPLVEGGNMVKSTWWQWLPKDFVLQNQHYHSVLIAADTAYKEKTVNDYSAIAIGGITARGDIHILKVVRERLAFPDLKAKLITLNALWRPKNLRAIVVEDKASGQSVVQELRRESGISVIARNWPGDKVVHLSSILPLIEGGRVYLPHKDTIDANVDTSWLPDFLTEIEQFPSGAFDDQVDAISLLIHELAKSSITPEMMIDQFNTFTPLTDAARIEGIYGQSLNSMLKLPTRSLWGD